jgi:hypothetical protein
MFGFPTDPQNARHFDTAPILQSGVTNTLGFGIAASNYPATPINIYDSCCLHNFTGKAVMHYAYFRPKAPGNYYIADIPSGSTVFMWNGVWSLAGYAFGYNQNYYGAPYGSKPRYQCLSNVKVGDVIPVRILAFKSPREPSDGGLTHAGFDFKIFGPANDPDANVLVSSTKSGEEYFFRTCAGQAEFKGLGTKVSGGGTACAAVGGAVKVTETVADTTTKIVTAHPYTAGFVCPVVTCEAVTIY